MRYTTASIIIIFVSMSLVWLAPVLAYGYDSEVLLFGPKGASGAVDKSGDLKLSSLYMLNLGRSDPATIIVALINIILTFLGFAGMVVLVYAGVLWATARGNSEQVDKAKNLIRRSATGVIIVLAASAINILIFYLIQTQFYA